MNIPTKEELYEFWKDDPFIRSNKINDNCTKHQFAIIKYIKFVSQNHPKEHYYSDDLTVGFYEDRVSIWDTLKHQNVK